VGYLKLTEAAKLGITAQKTGTVALSKLHRMQLDSLSTICH